MPLEKYKQKRNFQKTPEPAGSPAAVRKSAAKKTDRFFCVQKHLASHLHYDFRLEHNGVLLSWAVPKGPSLDPGTKRLAMHVEDHPIEYGEFEGVIPEGYGAGIVMLWDRGTWTPEVDDVDAALKKGDLKFTLDGYKLKGSWVLVRTKGPSYGEGRSWLLIKHRDDWAGPVDIAEFAPLSVKSGGDFEDILAADTPAIWKSNRPAKGGATGKDAGRNHPEGGGEEGWKPAGNEEQQNEKRKEQRHEKGSNKTPHASQPSAANDLYSFFVLRFSLQQSLPQREPHRSREPPPSVARDFILPEISFDQLGAGRQAAQLERTLFFRGISREHVGGRSRRVVNDDVHGAADGLADLTHAVAGGKSVHAAAFGQEIRDQNDGAAHVLQRVAHAIDEKNRHQARVKAARPDQHRVERADRRVDSGMNLRRRLEPDPLDELAAALPAIDFHFPARLSRRCCIRRTRSPARR